MPKLMFYCQHILGMGHLVRSMEIVRGLTKDFQVYFINGGQIVEGFEIPSGVEVINLPAIKTDSEFRELQVIDNSYTLAEVQEIRRNILLEIYENTQPDLFIVELFPFGRRRFSFELIPLLEKIKQDGKTKVVSSLRDIVVTKQDQARHEAKVCKLINQYFDLLLIHGDPKFQPLEETFSRVKDLNCEVHYTGYVVQPQPRENHLEKSKQPMILVSVGGGRFGHELLDCVVETAPLLATKLPHQIQIFTGPFIPEEKFIQLKTQAAKSNNIKCDRFTSNLLRYMKQADLSISMAGYNTTMNILTTGVRAMMMAFTGNDDQEQRIRAQKLANLGILEIINPQELQPEIFAQKIINSLQTQPKKITFDFNGVDKTTTILKKIVAHKNFTYA